jgi:hypothetical protein
VRQRLVGLLAVGLLVAGCGGSGDADELVDALSDTLWEEAQPDVEQGTLPFEFTEADADCLAQVTVDAIGYDTLTEAGVTAEAVRAGGLEGEATDFLRDNPDAANAFVDGMNQCIDIVTAIADEFAAEMGVSEESARCIGDGFMNQDAFRDSMIESLVGDAVNDPLGDDPDAIGALYELMNDCLTDEELAAMMGG